MRALKFGVAAAVAYFAARRAKRARAAPTGDKAGKPGRFGPRPRRTTKTQKGKGRPIATKPDPDKAPGKDLALQWNRFAVGPRAALEVYVGDVSPGQWRADLYVVGPGIDGSIGFPAKVGKDEYGWNDAPPGGPAVMEAVVNGLNGVLSGAEPIAGAVGTAYGVPPGVVSAALRAVKKLIDLIPSAFERGRVRAWARWREGEKGDPAERSRIRAEVDRWRDGNGLHAMDGSVRYAWYHWEGSTGELPLLPAEPRGGKPIPIVGGYATLDQPRVTLAPKIGTDWQSVTLSLPDTEQVPGGERRYVFVVQRDNKT